MPGLEEEVAPKISVSEQPEESHSEQDEAASIEIPANESEAQGTDEA
jgi:hypothetical protein